MGNQIQRKMAAGATWMVLFKLIERSIGLISTLILARILSPSDFGVIAMALSFIFFAEQLTAFSFDIALIHNQSATREHFDTAWTGNLLLGLSITLFMLLAAYPIAYFYKHPELVWVVCALALGPLISGAENIGVVAFRKELNFRKEFLFQLSRKAVGFLIVVPMAVIVRNYWALVAGILFSKLAGTVVSYLMHAYRPRFTLSRVGELMGYSKWLLTNNLIGFFQARTTDFFIGRLFGAGPLGVYNIAYEFAHLPSTELSAPINRALLPGFAKMADSEEVSRGYANALSMMAMFAIPCSAGLAVLAPFFVPAVLGAKWLAAVPLMQVLAFNGAVLMFHSPAYSVLIARGYPGVTVIPNGLYVLLLASLIASMALGSWQPGLLGVAMAALLSSLLCTPVYLYILLHKLFISPLVFLRAIVRPVGASALMALVLVWSLPAYERTMSEVAAAGWLLLGVGVGSIAYVLALAALWALAKMPHGPERVVFERVKELVSKLESSPPPASE